uniref:Macro domain-containing protein n=1 Tax=Xiphophorus maculatus TaxID=8083 RepID=A0A3B5QJN3_XIPMA
ESRCSFTSRGANLFSCPGDESLALCISEDCGMGAGIAAMFKKKFGRVSELKEQSEVLCNTMLISYIIVGE